MTLEQQLVSRELAQKMKELGFKQESLFYFLGRTICDSTRIEVELAKLDKNQKEFYSAYTVAELGDMLPERVKKDGNEYSFRQYKRFDNGWDIYYWDKENEEHLGSYYEEATEANARAKMLVFLKENNWI